MNILKARAGFGLMTYRFLVKALTNCTTLLGSISGKEFIKLLLDFIEVRSNMKVPRLPFSQLVKNLSPSRK